MVLRKMKTSTIAQRKISMDDKYRSWILLHTSETSGKQPKRNQTNKKERKKQQHKLDSDGINLSVEKSRSTTKGTRASKKTKSGKTRTKALLIKPNKRRSFAEVLREMAVADVKSIRRTRTGGILPKLGSNTHKKNTFCETI